LESNYNKILLQNKNNENVYLHSNYIVQVKELHDKLLKEKTNYFNLNNKYTELQAKCNIIEKENKNKDKKIEKLEFDIKNLYLWKNDHKCYDNINMDEVKKDIINKINIKETQEYIDLKSVNESYTNKITKMEEDMEKIQLKFNIEDNVLFKQLKEQNILLSETNKTLKTNYDRLELDNKKIKQDLLDIKKDNFHHDEAIIKQNEIEVNIENTILENKDGKIVEENIIKIINKLDKLYRKDFTDEQITINKSLISFYSKIYDLIKDKDEKKDAQYINEIIDSASTDTNRARFKKILKVSNFINNHTFLERSAIVIPLYMFKTIPIKSMNLLFLTINTHFKDRIIDDNDNNQ
jgi:hypothetical protein